MKILKSKELLGGLAFPECPRWKDDSLWFSNIYADQVISINPEGKVLCVKELPAIGLGWLDSQTLIFNEHSLKNQRVLKLENNKTSVFCNTLSKLSKFIFNDMVIHQKGFIYIGNTGCNAKRSIDWKTIEPGPIVKITKDADAQIVAEGLMCPNGLCISENGEKLIVSESRANRLTQFDIDVSGNLSNKRLFTELGSEYSPDGICIDTEGAVWVAALNGCLRVKFGGEVTHKVETIGKTALACMLGGKDRKTLFICTKDTEVDMLSDYKNTSTGRIEFVEVDSPQGAGRP